MSDVVIASNTSIRVAGSIGISASINTATLYTVPANSYAVVNCSILANTAGNTQDGFYAILRAGGAFICGANGATYGTANSIYVGPGQTIAVSGFGSVGTVAVSGALFTNSP